MRGVYVGILAVLLVFGAVAGIAQAGKPGKDVVYVDDDHQCGGYKPCYGTIQKGVDAAKSGADVIVYGGYYEENVEVRKPVQILPADPADAPVVDGDARGPTFSVAVDGVAMAGLYVTNGLGGIVVAANTFVLTDAEVVYNLGDGVEIVGGYGTTIGPGNILSDNAGSGLYATMTVLLTVKDNAAERNGGYGIYVGSSQDATVTGNAVSDNGLDGILFWTVDPSFLGANTATGNSGSGINVTSSQSITVYGNAAQANGDDGIAFWEVDPSFISGNTATGNGGNGIGAYYSNYITVSGNTANTNGDDGIAFWEVDPSTIFGNTASGNGGNGFGISSSQDITVSGNTATANGDDGIAFWEVDPSFITGNTASGNANNGISATQSTAITVSGNTANTNGDDGIAFWEVDPSYILENDIEGNGGDGVDLLLSTEILVRDNTIRGNAFGIRLGRSNGNQVFQNNFIENTISLSVFDSSSNVFDSGCDSEAIVGNYWSDYTGGDDGTLTSRCGERRIAGDGIGDAYTSYMGADYYPVLEPNGWIAIQARMRLGADLQPRTDDKDSKGSWVAVHIYVPESSGYHARDIVKSSLTLAGNLGKIPWDPKSPSSVSEGQDGYSTLHVKFSRQAWVPMVFPGKWCYAILGSFRDGQTFMAVACVTVTDPP